MKPTKKELKDLYQCFKYRLLQERYKSPWHPNEYCSCGGIFVFVESNFPYNDVYLQCNQCDGTKIL